MEESGKLFSVANRLQVKVISLFHINNLKKKVIMCHQYSTELDQRSKLKQLATLEL